MYPIMKGFKSGNDLYATFLNRTTGYIYDAGDTAWEEIGTFNDARRDACDVALTDLTCDVYVLTTRPTGIAASDDWLAVICEREGASPASTDPVVGFEDSRMHWLRNLLEADWSIDTTTTPWDMVAKVKGTAIELVRKELTDISGNNLTAISTIIGAATEP